MSDQNITPECREFVDRGAKWLDRVYPEWWATIDLAQLNLQDACRCVLGQLAGVEGDRPFIAEDGSDKYTVNGYCRVQAVIRTAGLDDEWWMARHGFEHSRFGGYHALDEAWIDEIKRRWEVGVR